MDVKALLEAFRERMVTVTASIPGGTAGREASRIGAMCEWLAERLEEEDWPGLTARQQEEAIKAQQGFPEGPELACDHGRNGDGAGMIVKYAQPSEDYVCGDPPLWVAVKCSQCGGEWLYKLGQ